jgi:hypothetical protein
VGGSLSFDTDATKLSNRHKTAFTGKTLQLQVNFSASKKAIHSSISRGRRIRTLVSRPCTRTTELLGLASPVISDQQTSVVLHK